MIPVKALEFKMAGIIRAGLRQAMRNADPRDIAASLREAEDRLTDTLYDSLYAQILKTYSEGYVSAGNLIVRHAPARTMLTAAAPAPIEDPRIAKATETVLLGITKSLKGQRFAIQAEMTEGFDRGESIPKLSRRLTHYFDDNRAASTRFARTTTNDIYNRAHLDRYEDSGVVDGVQYSAHIDDRTSDICTMLNQTIWGLGDKDIQVPPMHFSCRSRLVPYFGKIPGARNFKKEFGSDFVTDATKVSDTFRKSYWSPMPHTKASATYQRSYFKNKEIKTIKEGLKLTWQKDRDNVHIERLKSYLILRKTRGSVITDQYGKSVLLGKAEEHEIRRSIHALIVKTERKITREVDKVQKELKSARKVVEKSRRDRIAFKKYIVKKEKALAKAEAARDVQEIDDLIRELYSDNISLKIYLEHEKKSIDYWKALKVEPATDALWQAKRDKERYNAMLDSFKFQKR